MRRLVEELKRRNVFRIAIAYVAVCWLLLQVAALIFDAFDLPRVAIRVMIAVLLLGLVPTLVFAWVYEVGPDGLRRENDDVDRGGPRLTDRKLKFILIGVLAGVGAILLSSQMPDSPSVPAKAKPIAAELANRSIKRGPGRQQPSASSIAVLPFADMSQARDQGYFSDGMSEELLNLLAQVPGLRVAGRTSSFSFRGKSASIGEIGKALNVSTVLEGSVRKSGSRIRITAQLISVADGYHLWSQTYERKLTDVFALQDEIAGAVVEVLKVKLLPGAHAGTSGRFVPMPEAYDQFLLGKQFANRNTKDGYDNAMAAYHRALAIEPAYAEVYAALSLAEKSASFLIPSAEGFMQGQQRALHFAEQAIVKGPGLADGYAARGAVRIESWDWEGAQADLNKARELNPQSIATYACSACLLASRGQLPQAIAAVTSALELNPLSSEDWQKLGRFHTATGELTAARQALNRGLAISPDDGTLPYYLGVISLLEGQPEATRAASNGLTNAPSRLVLLAVSEHDLGRKPASQQALDTLVQTYSDDFPYRIAEVYAWRGERDHAMDWLERSYAQHDRMLRFLKFNPLLRNLHGDARYSSLLRKMGLPV